MSWLDTTRAINWTIVLHIFIAASGAYVFARSTRGVRLSIAAAFLAAISFGLGGYLGTQIEHVNQLQGLAWIGWIFLAYEFADKAEFRIRNSESKMDSASDLLIAAAIAGRAYAVGLHHAGWFGLLRVVADSSNPSLPHVRTAGAVTLYALLITCCRSCLLCLSPSACLRFNFCPRSNSPATRRAAAACRRIWPCPSRSIRACWAVPCCPITRVRCRRAVNSRRSSRSPR